MGLAMLMLPSAAAVAGPPAPAPDLLPDLRMLTPREVRIERRPEDARWLRFTTISVNVGEGPFEVRGRRECASLEICPKDDRPAAVPARGRNLAQRDDHRADEARGG